MLDLEIDPKLAWALKNRHRFPVDVNRADREMLLQRAGTRQAKAVTIRSCHGASSYPARRSTISCAWLSGSVKRARAVSS